MLIFIVILLFVLSCIISYSLGWHSGKLESSSILISKLEKSAKEFYDLGKEHGKSEEILERRNRE